MGGETQKMKEFMENAMFFGTFVSLAAYGVGMMCRKKFKSGLFNPLLIAIIITIAVVLICNISYDKYYDGAKCISYLLTPATVCLAVPLYEKLELLKKNYRAILAGILSGTVMSLFCVLGMALLFGMSHEEYVTLLPKSITTAIGMGVSEELGGYVSVTAAVIIITGVLGNVCADAVLKLFGINEPIAKGIALGTSAHAVGTAKAMELGDVEGAMSGLSIVVAGILTVIGASVFAQII